jgi:hypothetical protein
MTIEDIKEHEDGSATVVVNMSSEEITSLFQFGFIEALKNGMRTYPKKPLLSDEELDMLKGD